MSNFVLDYAESEAINLDSIKSFTEEQIDGGQRGWGVFANLRDGKKVRVVADNVADLCNSLGDLIPAQPGLTLMRAVRELEVEKHGRTAFSIVQEPVIAWSLANPRNPIPVGPTGLNSFWSASQTVYISDGRQAWCSSSHENGDGWVGTPEQALQCLGREIEELFAADARARYEQEV